MLDAVCLADSVISDLRVRQLAAWEAGDRLLVETLCATHPEVRADAEVLLDLIYAEVLLREEFGESPTLDEYLERFPTHEAALRRLFAFHLALEALPQEESRQTSAVTTVTDLDSPEPGETPFRVPGYDLLGEIGRGGMGIVYRARQVGLGRVVALKMILGAGSSAGEAPGRFQAEAAVIARLQHPGIVQIHEMGVHEGRPYFSLEYCAGGSLDQRLRGTPLSPREAATLVCQLAQALQYAHDAGVIHRDLKPGNILLVEAATSGAKEPNLQPKIADFGLARQIDAPGQTQTGAIMGTPSYMAPEQARGHHHEVGPCSDVYGLGAVFYEMLTGRPPFKADTVLNTLAQVVREDPASPRVLQPGVPRDLETICLHCLDKVPARRYASAKELADDLTRFLQGEPIQARPASWLEHAGKWIIRHPTVAALSAVSAVALVALIAMWGVFTLRLEDEKRTAVKARDEAIEQRKRAEREKEEARRQSLRAGQLLTLASTAVDEIAVNVRSAKLSEGKSKNPGEMLFRLACFYARSSRTLRQDADLVVEDRDRLADQYAQSAVRLLGCAESVGFFASDRPENRHLLQQTADLAILRSRPDYASWLAQLR